MSNCTYPGCNYKGQVHYDLCPHHYAKLITSCRVDGCKKKSYMERLCLRHFMESRQHD